MTDCASVLQLLRDMQELRDTMIRLDGRVRDMHARLEAIYQHYGRPLMLVWRNPQTLAYETFVDATEEKTVASYIKAGGTLEQIHPLSLYRSRKTERLLPIE
jgi:hypothetical protein